MAKKLGIAAAILVVCLGVFLLTNPGLDVLANFAEQNWDISPSAPSILYKTGLIAFYTLRFQKCIEYLENLVDWCGPDHPLTPDAALKVAKCYVQIDKRVDGYNWYLWFIETYPDDPRAIAADKESKTLMRH